MAKRMTKDEAKAQRDAAIAAIGQDVYDAWRDAKGKARRPLAEIGDAELMVLAAPLDAAQGAA
jgi:hypothetical protein